MTLRVNNSHAHEQDVGEREGCKELKKWQLLKVGIGQFFAYWCFFKALQPDGFGVHFGFVFVWLLATVFVVVCGLRVYSLVKVSRIEVLAFVLSFSLPLLLAVFYSLSGLAVAPWVELIVSAVKWVQFLFLLRILWVKS